MKITPMKIALLFGMLGCYAVAQPPDLIRVVREAPIEPYVSGKSPVDVVGMSAISGNSETWIVELHDSFASIEVLDRAIGGGINRNSGVLSGDEVLPSTRAWVARHRPNLSYRPEQAMQNLAKARYVDVVVYRIPAGNEASFQEYRKLRDFGLDSVNSDFPDMSYEVISGAPAGTYISLIPISSLASFDEGRARTPVYAQSAVANAKALAQQMQVQRERLWFRVEPHNSYVSEKFSSPDPGFWHPAAK
jgi:hypothetical protein